ncbi:MAG: hypothetical protein QMC90_04435 [Dehalococcoidales bacterium]|nr:hypothetical protein [Dehalococcoidales bacterium]
MGIVTSREMGILKIVLTLEGVDAATIARKMGVPSEYAAALCSTPAQDGYLKETKGVYKLTPAGESDKTI